MQANQEKTYKAGDTIEVTNKKGETVIWKAYETTRRTGPSGINKEKVLNWKKVLKEGK